MILIFITSTIGIFFLRETKDERALKHLQIDIFEEDVPLTEYLK
jgi:hypothetical protein